MADTTVRCWGNNHFDQVGPHAGEEQHRPFVVAGLRGVDRIAVGDSFACALMQDTTVRCWGANGYGALGMGDEEDRDVPTEVPNLRDVTQIATGWATCALLRDGSVSCWGDWDPGFGDPRSIGSKSPLKVLAVTDAVEVAVGRSHSCARRRSGAVSCWRHISPGLVPRGKARADPVAVRVGDAVSIALDEYGAAVTRSGEVRCWGYGSCGFDLGRDGPGSLDYGASFLVPKLSHVVEIALGGGERCVRRDDGDVLCEVEKKDGRKELRIVPGVAKAKQIAAGSDHACALLDGGALVCWGRNTYGQLGDGTTTDRAAPVAVRF